MRLTKSQKKEIQRFNRKQHAQGNDKKNYLNSQLTENLIKTILFFIPFKIFVKLRNQ